MKMTDKFLSAVVLTAATAALCTSCSTDTLAEQQQNEAKAVSLTATLNETPTRAGLNSRSGNTHTLYWHDSDQILVRTKSTADGSYEGVKFDIAEGTATGVTSATFKGLVGDDAQIDTYAVYPYDADYEFTDENSLTFHLPSEYEYTTVESGIFPKDGTYRTTNTCVPMLGTISDGTASFKHLGGLLVIRIDKMPAESGKFIVSADQRLTGDFTVADLSASDAKIATEDASTENSVTFNYSNATEGAVGVFYLPVPTGSYTNLKVNMAPDDATATSMTATYGSLNVERADIIAIPVYAGTDLSFSCDYVVNGHKFVDLCLPSGTLWAETNVGAETAADYGDFYAWGEIETQTDYSWNTYKYNTSSGSMTKYNSTDGKTILDNEDDAAYMNWGSFCRMPIPAEFTELLNYCSWEWTTMSNSANIYVNGCKVTSNKNGNSIFLPASGCHLNGSLDNQGSDGYYWSSSLYYSSANDLGFGSSGYHKICDNGRCNGFSVRPVAKTYSKVTSGATAPDMSTSGFDTGWE